MKSSFVAATIAALLTTVAVAESPGPESWAKTIAPLVEENTALVVRVDLSRFDVKAVSDLLERVTPISAAELDKVKKRKLGLLEEAARAGVGEFYLVLSFSDLVPPLRMFVAVPVSGEEQEKKLVAALRLKKGEYRTSNGLLVFQAFQPITADKLDFSAAPRPDLVEAFRATAGGAVQVCFIPSRDSRRVIGELYPELPKQFGGGPSSILTRGIRWAAVGVNLVPSQSMRLVVQSDDAQAAAMLRTKLADMLQSVGKLDAVRKAVPKFDQAAAILLPKAEDDRLVLSLNKEGVENVLSLLALPVDEMRTRSAHVQSMNNLKRIGLAMHNYCQAQKHFPLPASRGPDGQPLLSWRVHVLQYFPQKSIHSLYKQFHLDEPWDSPHNRALIERMPDVYRMPLSSSGRGRTNYLLPVGNGAAFSNDKATTYLDLKDGTENTIMAVEVGDKDAVVWTKPVDWKFDPNRPFNGLGRDGEGGFRALFFDTSVSLLTLPQDPKNLRALFSVAGGDESKR